MELPLDEDLMEMVSDGQLDKLTILFDRHHIHLFNFLYKMTSNKMLSEDITQETFYKILKYRNSYNGGKFISWMFSIARNSLKNHFKKISRREVDLFDIEYKVGGELDLVNEDVSHLHLAISKLNKSDRELISLNKLQNIKYNELAEILDSSPGAVRTKVSRAIKKLKTYYFETL